MSSVAKSTLVQEFYVQVTSADDNHIVGLAMNACGMPEEEFFYYELCGIRNLWRCTKAQATAFKQKLRGIRIFHRCIDGMEVSELRDLTHVFH